MTDNGPTQPVKTAAAQRGAAFHLRTQEWIVIALIVLSIIGVGVTDFAPAVSHWYWLFMIILVAGAAAVYIVFKYTSSKAGREV